MSSAEIGDSGDGDRSEPRPEDSESAPELIRSAAEGDETAVELAAPAAMNVEIAVEGGAVEVAETDVEEVESPGEIEESEESPLEGAESPAAEAAAPPLLEDIESPGERTEPVTEAVDAAPEAVEPSQSRMPDLADGPGLRAAVEAILFVVESPVTLAALAAALRKPTSEIEAAVADLAADLDARGSGVELREVAGGVRLYTRPELGVWVEAFLLDGQRARLTQAALETLAVIAYRQPVTRARISAIRGVNVDGVVRTLTARGLITEVGADPDTGGGLYRTTDAFLEKMGLRSLDELPSLAPLLPELDGVESDEL